jgi:hypothetical protein
MSGTPANGRRPALLCFALVYAGLELAWWYALAPPGEDLVVLDIAAEVAIFGSSLAIAGWLLKTRLPALTNHDRHTFAIRCVWIVWAVLIAMAVVEWLNYGDAPFSSLFADYSSWSLVTMLGIAATLAVLAMLFMTNLYYIVARVILHFVARPNRIAAQ